MPPVLLEPIMKVEIFTPSDATAKIIALVPQRRGQILGYDGREGWPGWDMVEASMPQAEIGDLIIELRSATAGVATYRASFDRMAELTGRLADEATNANAPPPVADLARGRRRQVRRMVSAGMAVETGWTRPLPEPGPSG